MGDVALSVPVVRELVRRYPGLKVTYLSRPAFRALFRDIPGLDFYAADLDLSYRGLPGLVRLFRELKKHRRFDAVADLHGVIRSNVLSVLFKASGVKVVQIRKGRKAKRALTRKRHKELRPLKPTWQRYADVFKKLGVPVSLNNRIHRQPRELTEELLAVTGTKKGHWVGIAPFAKHAEKKYPAAKMKEVIRQLNQHPDMRLFIFGGGREERATALELENEFPQVTSLIGKLDLGQELLVISNLDVMISMDSAGMHLASIAGTPVVSIWGATHPYAGFLGYGQDTDLVVQDSIECRPCSVFGNKPCYRHDHACMHNIPPGLIVDKVLKMVVK